MAAVSVMMAGWQLSLYAALRYHSSSFIFLENLSDALGPRSKVQPSKSVHRPWNPVSVLESRLGYLDISCLYTFWDWRIVPCSCQSIFDSLPLGGRDGFDLTIPSPFLNLSCSYVEFTFCVFRNLCGLIKT